MITKFLILLDTIIKKRLFKKAKKTKINQIKKILYKDYDLYDIIINNNKISIILKTNNLQNNSVNHIKPSFKIKKITPYISHQANNISAIKNEIIEKNDFNNENSIS